MKKRNYRQYMKKVKKAKSLGSYNKEMEKATDKMLKDIKNKCKIILR
jgi:hypothetical protein